MHLIIALKHRKSQIYYDMPCLNLNMKYEVSQSNNRSYFSKISTEMWNHEQILESSLVVIGYFCGRQGTSRDRARPVSARTECLLHFSDSTDSGHMSSRQAGESREGHAARQGEEVERKPWFTGQHSGGLYKCSSLENWHAQERVWVWQCRSCLQKLIKELQGKKGV